MWLIRFRNCLTNTRWEVNMQFSNLRGSLLQVANLKFNVSVHFIYKLQFPQSKLQYISQYKLQSAMYMNSNFHNLPLSSLLTRPGKRFVHSLYYIRPLFVKICHFPEACLKELRKVFRAAKVREQLSSQSSI